MFFLSYKNLIEKIWKGTHFMKKFSPKKLKNDLENGYFLKTKNRFSLINLLKLLMHNTNQKFIMDCTFLEHLVCIKQLIK